MKVKDEERFFKTVKSFLGFNAPLLLYGKIIPHEIFQKILGSNKYTYIDVREIEAVSLLDIPSLLRESLVIFANVEYNKSIISYLKQFKQTFIVTSSHFVEIGIPLLVEHEFSKISDNLLINKTFEFVLENQIFDKSLYYKVKMIKERTNNIDVMDLRNRILVYDSFRELFEIDLIKEVYLTEEMIYAFKKEKVNHLLHHNYFFSKENIGNLYDILENIKYKENVALFGDTGTGKTSLVEFLAKIMKKELIVVNISSDTEISDFVGKFTMREKKLFFKEGFFLQALKKDCWLLLDEINLAPQEVLDFLESTVAKRSLFYNNSQVNFHENFLIFCCMNLNDVGKKDFNSPLFLKKEIKNSTEDFIGLNDKYNPNDERNLNLPITNKREYVRALKLLRSKYEIDFVYGLLYNKNFNNCLKEKRVKNEVFLDDYVTTEETEKIIKRVEMAIEVGYPVLLQGDTSTGKTSLVTSLAKKYNKRLYRINNHEQTEASDYFGNDFCMENNSNIQISSSTNGILSQAIQNGDWILLDELNLAPSEVLEVLNKILDTSYKHFRLFATQNLNYSGRKPLSKAFLSRFIVVDFNNKSSDELKKILAFKYPNMFNHKIIKAYDELKLYRNFNELITLRDCFRWSKRIKEEKDFYIKGLMVIYERQRKKDREIIKSYFLKYFDDYLKYFENKKESIIKYQEKDFIFNSSFTKLVVLILNAWKYKEPVLLIGETGIGKSRAIEMSCKILNREFITISMSGNTDPSDFVGSFSIDKNDLIWTDGPLTKAMKEGKVLILDEINLADNSVLERLNSVLEEERTLFLTEKNELIKAHDNFLIIASMNPSTDVGKRELSPALRNRFTEFFFELGDKDKEEIAYKMLNTNFDIKGMSLRKIELIRDFHRNVRKEYFNIFGNKFIDLEEVELSDHKIINDINFGIEPFIYKVKEKSDYDFNSLSIKSNLFSFLRALELRRPILLEGDCGCGKTSLIIETAKILGKKIYKINLCESTEMSDLIGQFMPSKNGIIFKEGIISVLKRGDWLLLDEINLCSQSVLEGLNSLLDYRRSFNSTYLSFVMHEDSRIFGTMNESSVKNKRNVLPRSFIDRFIKLKFILREEDIQMIMNNKGMIYYPYQGLRFNLLANKINKNYLNDRDLKYSFNDTIISFEDTNTKHYLNKNYTLIHSQLNDLDTFLRCMVNKIPVILIGKARNNFINGILNFYEIFCHEEMDVSDLIGQFIKINNDFIWEDSALIKEIRNKNSIYINSAHLVEKTVLDRINSLLEGSIEIFEYNNEILKNESFIILGTDHELSPAIMDRCVVLNPSTLLNVIDVYKIFNKGNDNLFNNLIITNDLNTILNRISLLNDSLNNKPFLIGSVDDTYDLVYLHKLKYDYLNDIPDYLKYTLPMMNDTELMRGLSFNELQVEVIDEELVDFYINNCFFFNKKNDDELSDSTNESEDIKNIKLLLTEESDNYKRNNFIKRISLLTFINEENFPLGIKELKKLVIKNNFDSLKNPLLSINYEINLSYDDTFNKLLALNIDPLVLKKKRLSNKIIKHYNDNRIELTNHYINLYKYGISNFNINHFTNTINELQSEIDEIKERDYNIFIDKLYSYTLLHNDDEFDDLLNYYKLSMLKQNIKNVLQCDKCVYMNNHNNCISYEYMIDPFDLSIKIIKEKNNILNFIHYLNINDFNNELSKYLINLILNKSTNDYSLITESIIHDNLIRSKVNIEKEEITNELLNDLLIYNYMKEIKEMKYFLVLFYYNMTHEDCQRYFLDCFVYECKERITYTKEYYNYLNKNRIIHSNTFTDHILLYNTSLLYSLLISNENKEKHVLSLINNELMINYNKKEGCLCYYNDKLNYYKRVKETEFYFSDICFCQKEFKKIELNLNEVFFTREPIKIYTREEKIIAYLM